MKIEYLGQLIGKRVVVTADYGGSYVGVDQRHVMARRIGATGIVEERVPGFCGDVVSVRHDATPEPSVHHPVAVYCHRSELEFYSEEAALFARHKADQVKDGERRLEELKQRPFTSGHELQNRLLVRRSSVADALSSIARAKRAEESPRPPGHSKCTICDDADLLGVSYSVAHSEAGQRKGRDPLVDDLWEQLNENVKLKEMIVALRGALELCAHPEDGWPDVEVANIYEDSRALVPQPQSIPPRVPAPLMHLDAGKDVACQISTDVAAAFTSDLQEVTCIECLRQAALSAADKKTPIPSEPVYRPHAYIRGAIEAQFYDSCDVCGFDVMNRIHSGYGIDVRPRRLVFLLKGAP